MGQTQSKPLAERHGKEQHGKEQHGKEQHGKEQYGNGMARNSMGTAGMCEFAFSNLCCFHHVRTVTIRIFPFPNKN
jgi:hypothetical protein